MLVGRMDAAKSGLVVFSRSLIDDWLVIHDVGVFGGDFLSVFLPE